MPYHVYILASHKNGALQIGVTNDLAGRVQELKADAAASTAKRPKPTLLVYAEEAKSIEAAIMREKHIRKWERSWKLQLIALNNPDWIDLHPKPLP